MAKVNSVIGVEFDSRNIRAVELTKGGDGHTTVTAFGRIPLQENIISGGVIADPNLFNQTLTSLMKECGFRNGSGVVIGVNNENVIMRYARFPKVPDDKLRGVVTMQAQDFIPVPVSELELDFVVVEDTVDDDDQPAINVLLVGARKTMISNFINCFEQAKLEVVDIDSTFLAWLRPVLATLGEEPAGLMMLTDDVLDFIAVSDREIKMVRSINIPDRASAEVKKAFNYHDQVTPEEMENITDLLYSELSSSINYYQMQSGGIIGSVFFTAATPLQGQLFDALNEKSYVPVTAPQLYAEYRTETFDPTDYASCISLAKAALGE
ncbi:MAG: pilus assembly protein PilM [Clostridia bacterium]|nr:pilus assembly protein PilM [Clostridia bacterium]